MFRAESHGLEYQTVPPISIHDFMAMMIRRIVRFTGCVQGVGFRYTTCDVATGYRVTGHVRNLADGRVEMVVEGESAEIDRLVAAVSDRMPDYIREVVTHELPATGEFIDFRISY